MDANHGGQIAKKIEEVNISLKNPLERQFAKKRPKMSAIAISFFGAIDPY